MKTVIRAEGLSKKYIIGHHFKSVHDTLRDAISAGLRSLISGSGGHNPRLTREEFWALEDINFEVKEGDRVGIIGKNGAGKSTLLKILSRITEPTKGRALIKGRVASLLEVGTGFHPELTGRENIYLNGSIMGMSKAEINSKYDEIISFAGVEKFLDTPIKRYSSGMKVRLAFAVAAHLEPEILLVDEVLAVGDYVFQKKSLGKMEDISKQGRTIIFVSHNMPAITSLCTRAMLLEKGGIVKEGDAVSVVGHYYSEEGNSSASVDFTSDEEKPGDDVVRLLRVTVEDQDGKVTNELGIDQPFYVTMEYELFRAGHPLGVSVSFHTEDGTFAFWSSDMIGEGVNDKRKTPGLYRSRLNVPGSLLNGGLYFLSIAIVNPEALRGNKHCVEKNLLRIHVVDPIYEVRTRGRYVGPYPGAVRPLLEWDVSRLG